MNDRLSDLLAHLFAFDVTADLLGRSFVQQALIAAALLALVAGLIGPFIVMRQMSFAVHGSSELSLTGAAFALLTGLNVGLGALVADPAVLIVDEPLADLDPRHAWDAARRLQQLAVQHGKLVIATIHDLNIALRRATRIWALQDGRLLADGPPREVITGALLGELFGLAASVHGDGGRMFVDFSSDA